MNQPISHTGISHLSADNRFQLQEKEAFSTGLGKKLVHAVVRLVHIFFALIKIAFFTALATCLSPLYFIDVNRYSYFTAQVKDSLQTITRSGHHPPPLTTPCQQEQLSAIKDGRLSFSKWKSSVTFATSALSLSILYCYFTTTPATQVANNSTLITGCVILLLIIGGGIKIYRSDSPPPQQSKPKVLYGK